MLFAEFIDHALRSTSPLQRHRYMVIDLAALYSDATVRHLARDGAATDLLRGGPVDWTDTASPVMVPLPRSPVSAQAASAWVRLAWQWRYANALSYVETSLGAGDAAAAMKRRCHVTLPGGMTAVLRWFDNRTMDALLSLLVPANRALLLGDWALLAYADRHGNLKTEEPSTPTALPSPLRLDADEEAALLEASEPDNLIDLLLQQSQAQLVAMLPPEQFRVVSSLWQEARRRHILQTPDQAAYCSLALELGPDFTEMEPWRSIVAEAEADDGRLLKALAAKESSL